jgi:hypothetical protein
VLLVKLDGLSPPRLAPVGHAPRQVLLGAARPLPLFETKHPLQPVNRLPPPLGLWLAGSMRSPEHADVMHGPGDGNCFLPLHPHEVFRLTCPPEVPSF